MATGDDAEKESPDEKMNHVTVRKASPKQIAVLYKGYQGQRLKDLLEANGIERLEDISMQKASELIGKMKGER